jgi:hypothetical protein
MANLRDSNLVQEDYIVKRHDCRICLQVKTFEAVVAVSDETWLEEEEVLFLQPGRELGTHSVLL